MPLPIREGRIEPDITVVDLASLPVTAMVTICPTVLEAADVFGPRPPLEAA